MGSNERGMSRNFESGKSKQESKNRSRNKANSKTYLLSNAGLR